MLYYWLSYLVCMAIAPIFAARSRGRTLLGVVVAALSFGVGYGCLRVAETDLRWAGWALLGMFLLPPLISFGFSIGMLMLPRRKPKRS